MSRTTGSGVKYWPRVVAEGPRRGTPRRRVRGCRRWCRSASIAAAADDLKDRVVLDLISSSKTSRERSYRPRAFSLAVSRSMLCARAANRAGQLLGATVRHWLKRFYSSPSPSARSVVSSS